MEPHGMSVDGKGNVYVLDSTDNPSGYTGSNRILVCPPNSTKFTTYAGSYNGGYRDGFRLQARFHSPQGIFAEIDGSLIIADTGNRGIRRISPQGEVTTITSLPVSSNPWGCAEINGDIWFTIPSQKSISYLSAKTTQRYVTRKRAVLRCGISLGSGYMASLDKGMLLHAIITRDLPNGGPKRVKIRTPASIGGISWRPGLPENRETSESFPTELRSTYRLPFGWVSMTGGGGVTILDAYLARLPAGERREALEIQDTGFRIPKSMTNPRPHGGSHPIPLPEYKDCYLANLPCWMCKYYGHSYRRCTTPELALSNYMPPNEKNKRDGQQLWKWIKAWDIHAEPEGFLLPNGTWMLDNMRYHLWGPYLHRIPLKDIPFNQTAIQEEYGRGNITWISSLRANTAEGREQLMEEHFRINADWLNETKRIMHNHKHGRELLAKLRKYDPGFQARFPYFSRKSNRYNFRALKREIKEHERFIFIRNLTPGQIADRARRLGWLERERQRSVRRQRKDESSTEEKEPERFSQMLKEWEKEGYNTKVLTDSKAKRAAGGIPEDYILQDSKTLGGGLLEVNTFGTGKDGLNASVVEELEYLCDSSDSHSEITTKG
ncbi:hypothetical protein AAMO2058_001142400 [Amorphochlora amoebiformis]